jgi:GTP-binding protein
MKIVNAFLKIIATRISQYPDDELPEFLLVGRSNVGKSSFINTITGNKKMARVSNTPGKTRNLNFYLLNNSFYLVDVPGYGYASVSKKEQRKFGLMIEEYLEKRPNLIRTFMLVDLRHKPSDDDVLMYKYLKHFNLPVTVIATKADKISKNKREKAKNTILKALGLQEGDTFIVLSNTTREGKEKVLKEIESLIGEEETL